MFILTKSESSLRASLPSLYFLIRTAFGVARLVARVKHARNLFHDLVFILEDTC